MGRNRIKIEKIKSEKNKNITYVKRKKGLIKKAMELSLLCEAKIFLCLIPNNSNQMSLFCSSNSIDNFIEQYIQTPIKASETFYLKDVNTYFNFIFQYNILFKDDYKRNSFDKQGSKKEKVNNLEFNKEEYNEISNLNNKSNYTLMNKIPIFSFPQIPNYNNNFINFHLFQNNLFSNPYINQPILNNNLYINNIEGWINNSLSNKINNRDCKQNQIANMSQNVNFVNYTLNKDINIENEEKNKFIDKISKQLVF